jgi:hypothetical protein
MKTAIIVARGASGHQQHWGGAFAAGLAHRGWKVHFREDDAKAGACDLLVLWGVRRREAIARQKAAGGEVCILERGYLGDRFAWTSVSFGGGLNGRAEFRGVSDDPRRFGERFAPLMRPWNTDGRYALLIGQVPTDQSVIGRNIDRWYHRTIGELRSAGWHDVRFRPHPEAPVPVSAPANVPVIGGTLASAMRDAGVVVTFNSNTGVEAALYGRPVIAMDEGSMAWDVAAHEVGEIVTPDRLAWAAKLAWCQWSREEMVSGACAEAVGL